MGSLQNPKEANVFSLNETKKKTTRKVNHFLKLIVVQRECI